MYRLIVTSPLWEGPDAERHIKENVINLFESGGYKPKLEKVIKVEDLSREKVPAELVLDIKDIKDPDHRAYVLGDLILHNLDYDEVEFCKEIVQCLADHKDNKKG